MIFNTKYPIHNMKIDFDNWGNFSEEELENKRIHLWILCGFKNQKEIDQTVTEYNKNSLFFSAINNTALGLIKKQDQGTKYADIKEENSRTNEEQKIQNELERQNICLSEENVRTYINVYNQILKDKPRTRLNNKNITKEEEDMVERCLSRIFIENFNEEWGIEGYDYVQGENTTSARILRMIINNGTNPDEIEPLLYHIYILFMFKMKAWLFMFDLPRDGVIRGTGHKDFFEWLIVTMIIKKNKSKWKKLLDMSNKKKANEIFTRPLEIQLFSVEILQRHFISGINPQDFKIIFTSVLENKNITMFFAYYISYLCSYTGHLMHWDDVEEDTDEHTFWDMPRSLSGSGWKANPNTYDVKSVSSLIRDKNVNKIKSDFDKIYKYFTNKGNMLRLVDIFLQSSLHKTHPAINIYDIPREFIKNTDIWEENYTTHMYTNRVAAIGSIMGGSNKKKTKRRKKRKTLRKYNKKSNRKYNKKSNRKYNKKSNRKLNRTIKLR
jgi:hypothetical protein